ncbi:hypothetical protein V8G54_020331 [Vigna mungo]|uniref:Uncharacterized protein n=1 Tax=Vigna mungo TaxID=3915 RepID=A0AAQ3NDJ2_VIGMU
MGFELFISPLPPAFTIWALWPRMGLRPKMRVSMHRRRRLGRIWIRDRPRWRGLWVTEIIFSVRRKHNRRRWSSCRIDGKPHRHRDRWVAARVLNFARGILYPIGSARAILRCQNRVP